MAEIWPWYNAIIRTVCLGTWCTAREVVGVVRRWTDHLGTGTTTDCGNVVQNSDASVQNFEINIGEMVNAVSANVN